MFTLQWTHRALVLLGSLWVEADEWDRQEIRSALHDLIVELTDRPHTVGESRAGNERVFYVPPLGVNYHVILDDQVVEIGRIWRIDQ